MVAYLKIAYRGTGYSGWQRQSNALTVQQLVEEAVGEILQCRVRAVGAGRTDAGVHASGQVAHLDMDVGSEPDADVPERALIHGTNTHLPPDISVMAAGRMPAGFHARKSAISKTYRYRMVAAEVLSPLESLFAIRIDPRIRRAAMREAAASLVGRHDFTAFALAGGSHTDPHRSVLRCELVEEDAGRLILEVEGDGFLRGMVRSLVGTLLEVGLGKRTPSEFTRLLSGCPRAEAGPTAPPQGLVLERVVYPPGPSE